MQQSYSGALKSFGDEKRANVIPTPPISRAKWPEISPNNCPSHSQQDTLPKSE
jgi:hypothetical protein